MLILASTTLVAQNDETLVVAYEEEAEIEPSSANKIGFAVGISASAIGGFGGEIVGSYNNKFALRIGYETFDYERAKPIAYSAANLNLNIYPKGKFGGFTVAADYYLFKYLYLTAGVMKSNLKIDASIQSAETVKIGDIYYTPEEMGEIQFSAVPTGSVLPFVGVGFGRNIAAKKGLSLNLELGAAFAKSYEVSVTGTKYFKGNNENKSIDKLNNALRNVSWSGLIPSIKIGLSYRFL